jgi:AraC-like DNA-binding protein
VTTALPRTTGASPGRRRTLAALAMRPVVAALRAGRTPDVPLPAWAWGEPRRRVCVRESDRLWVDAQARLGPALPLRIAAEVTPSTYGHLTYLLASVPTVEVALRQLGRRYRLLGDATAHQIEVGRKVARLRVILEGPPRPPVVETFAVAVVLAFLRRQTAGRFTARRVALMQSSPSEALAAAHRHGMATEVDFDASWCGIEIDRADLGLHLHSAEPELARLLEAHADLLATAPEEAGIVERVADRIGAEGPRASCRAADIAADLGMSERTLRRRLAGAATSFQAVLDEVLRSAAEDLLAAAHVHEVAEALGYADAAAFRRAYRRWTGAPPRGPESPLAARVRGVEHERRLGHVGLGNLDLDARQEAVAHIVGVGGITGPR